MNGGNAIKICVTASIACATVFLTRRIFGLGKNQYDNEENNFNEECLCEEVSVDKDGNEVSGKAVQLPSQEMNVFSSPVSSIDETTTLTTMLLSNLSYGKSYVPSKIVHKQQQAEKTANVNMPNRKTIPKEVEKVAGRRHRNAARRRPKKPLTNLSDAHDRISDQKTNRAWSSVPRINCIKDNGKRNKGKRDIDVVRRVAPQRVRESRLAKAATVIRNNAWAIVSKMAC